MNLAPVIIFNYNRPDHSQQVWDTLAKNELAADTELYLYCDGPKANASKEMRARVLSLQEQAKQYAVDAKMQGLFKAVHVVCAEKNKGLANSIIDGVTDVINMHERVIVLEDDLLTSPYFLKYMNEGLDVYAKRPSVFSISGYNYPQVQISIPADYKHDVYVGLRACSWGWATWKNRWEAVDWSLDYLEDFLRHPEQIAAFNRGGDDLTEMLCLQRDHKIDSWAIRFCFAHFKEHAVAIMPCISYIDNVGFDGSGVHCSNQQNSIHSNLSLSPKMVRWLEILYEDSHMVNSFYNIYCRSKRPFWQRAINTLYRKIGKPIPFIIKKKVYAD